MASGCIVVTGGGGALGGAVVRELAHRGYEVAIVDSAKAEGRAKEIAASLGGKAVAFGFDVTSSEAWTTAVAAIEKRGMPIIGAALIAGGWAGGKPVHEESDDTVWHRMLQANTETAYQSVRALLPGMVAHKHGSIVIVGSRAVERPFTSANAAAYAVSKTAAVALAEVVAEEVRDSGVRVNAVMPSTIDTPANRIAMPNVDPNKWVKAESIAKVIAFLVSDDARDVSGAAI
ncbi:MAG: SDR family NAD(P)-dependent oxidoreductase, partial [Polyangiaceae bacterium]